MDSQVGMHGGIVCAEVGADALENLGQRLVHRQVQEASADLGVQRGHADARPSSLLSCSAGGVGHRSSLPRSAE